MASNRPTADQRLSMIEEDGAHQPSASRFSTYSGNTTPSNRPRGRAWKDAPPRASAEAAPPQYTLWDVTGPRGEKLLDVRNNKHIAKRGGWKRLLLLVLLAVAVLAIGLGVGLGVGLARRNANNQASQPSAPSPTSTNATAGPFPQGSYVFDANLANISTSCTSNAATWLCWPYNTYGNNPGQSGVTFNWIIGNTTGDASGGSPNLNISTSANPFALSFSNVSLTLRDAGTSQERYIFTVSLDKYVQTSESLSGNGALDGCWFRSTTLSGALYTKMKPSAGSGGSNATGAAFGWASWPYAMAVNQTIGGGQNVPSCYELTSNEGQGPAVTQGLSAQPASATCGCYWRNFDL